MFVSNLLHSSCVVIFEQAKLTATGANELIRRLRGCPQQVVEMYETYKDVSLVVDMLLVEYSKVPKSSLAKIHQCVCELVNGGEHEEEMVLVPKRELEAALKLVNMLL